MINMMKIKFDWRREYMLYVMAIGGIILFRELPEWWNLLAWIPIIVGFHFYYRWDYL